MTSTTEVVILGAGIVGAACARECALRGLSTLIVEAGIVGGGATAAGMGHIVLLDSSPMQFALTRYSQQLWLAMAPELPSKVEFEQCGTLWVANGEEEMSAMCEKHALYASMGIKSEVLDAHALAEAEPQLRRSLAGALLVPSDAVLYPPCAAEFMVRDAVRMGARLLASTKVLAAGSGRVRLASGAEVHAQYIVNACGVEAVTLLPELPISKRKGHLVITDRYPGFVRHQLVEPGYVRSAESLTSNSVAFNVQPRQTGQILIGSSREYGAEDATINRLLLEAMVTRAKEYLPRITNLDAIRIWTGFRAATPDNLPLIGPWPKDDTLYLAAGHEGLGITSSLATAKLLAAAILGEEPEIPVQPYLPARFLGKSAAGSSSSAHAPEGAHV